MTEEIRGLPATVAPARVWVAYDRAVRREHYWIPDPASVPEQVREAGVALCHGDGRVREAALRGEPAAPVVPLVVLRCADWAPQVREAARQALDRVPGRVVAEAAHVVLGAAARQYGGHALRVLEERLREDADGARACVLAHPVTVARRWGFQQAVENDWLSSRELADAAVQDADVLIQARCAQAALSGPSTEEALLDRLLTARAAGVRAVAVTALRRAGRAGEGVRFLDDRSAGVRVCAQWLVRQAGGDPMAHYREAVATGPGEVPRGGVAGIGECGQSGSGADAALLAPFLADPRSGVRAAAVGALAALGAAGPEQLAHLLDDPSPAVVRHTARALADDAGTLPLDGPEGLLTRLAPDRERHVRRAAFRLLAARRGLEPLRAALNSVDDPALWHMARSLAARWSPPDSAALAAALSPRERALLVAEITRAEPSLAPRTGVFLLWILKLREDRKD